MMQPEQAPQGEVKRGRSLQPLMAASRKGACSRTSRTICVGVVVPPSARISIREPQNTSGNAGSGLG